MSLFAHHHRAADGFTVYGRSETAPEMSVGGAVARVQICSCGAVLHWEITPAGYQQISWGLTSDEITGLVARQLLRYLAEKARQ